MDAGEVFVIVEYCRYGNLLSYLTTHRHKFVNQVDEFGSLLPIENLSAIKTNKNGDQIEADAEMTEEEVGYCEPKHQGEIELKLYQPTSPEDIESQHPDWMINYRTNDEVDTNCLPISTRELICWSFQIARRMDYLVSKKVQSI